MSKVRFRYFEDNGVCVAGIKMYCASTALTPRYIVNCSKCTQGGKISNYEFLIFICKNHNTFPVKGDIQEIEDGSRKTKVFIDDFDNTHLESQKIRAIYHILVAYYISDTKINYSDFDEFINHMQSVTKYIDEFVYLAN